MCLNQLNKMIRTLFTSVACLEQCSQHPGKQEEIVIKGSFKFQYVSDLHFTILFLFPLAPVKAWEVCMVRLALLCCFMHAWGTVEWQLCNEDENQSLLWRWRKKKPKQFSLNWSLGAFILLIAHMGQGCDSQLLTVLEDAMRGCTGLKAIVGGLYQWLWSCRIRISTEAVLLAYIVHAVFLFSSHLSVLVFTLIILFGMESTGVCK